MNFLNMIWTAVKYVWTLTVHSAKDTASALWKVIKAAVTNIRLYVGASSLERDLQKASYKASLKTWTVSAAAVIPVCFGILGIFSATVGSLLHFLPAFVLDAAGYLAVMLLLDVAIKTAERLSLRADVVCNMRKLMRFIVGAAIPWMILSYFRNPSDQNALNLLSCYMAFLAKAVCEKIREGKTASTSSAPVSTQA